MDNERPAPAHDTVPPAVSQSVPPPTARDWWALATLSVCLGLIVLDGTIVGVSLPQIIADLHLDLSQAQWVSSSYAVVLAALLLVTGKLADRWGRKRLVVLGLLVFVTGSVLAAMAHSGGALIASRVVQALGAAAIMPSTLSTVNATFSGRYRAAAFGVWGAVISGAAAIGPLAGGALTEYATWRWIFLVNVPLGAVVLAATWLTVRPSRGHQQGRGADVDGALLSAIGLGSLVFAVIEGPDLGWWTPERDLHLFGATWPASAPVSPIPVLAAIGLVCLALFVVWERHRARVGRSRLLDLSLFGVGTFRWGLVSAAAVAVGEFAMLFVLPLYLVNVLELSMMTAGWVMAAMAGGAFLSGAQARHLAARWTPPGVVVVGLVLEVIGTAVLAVLVTPTTSAWWVALPLALYGLGLGLASAQLTSTVLRDVPEQESGQASATQSMVRQVGSAWGTAVAGVSLSVALTALLPGALAAQGLPPAQVDQLVTSTTQSAGSTLPGLHAEVPQATDPVQAAAVVQSLRAGFTDATRWSLAVATVLLALGLAGSLVVARVSRTPQPAK